MKLWKKSYETNADVEKFTVGRDREFDELLAKHDVIGSIAHAKMLGDTGLISKEEAANLVTELEAILIEIKNNNFKIESNFEDVHSQIEFILTEKLGDTGKKIHTARSRNDQILLDIRLFLKEEFVEITGLVENLFYILIDLSEQSKSVKMPGYTHLQVAMPSSFGLWFGAYAESLAEDYELLAGALQLIDRNPLGSAAGYGSNFSINRELTTRNLGMSRTITNSVYSQMTRGKIEKIAANAITCIAGTFSKLSMDICLYASQNFAFLKLPKEFTTGSSIMPHKQNPDIFELIRGKCNKIQGVPMQLTLLGTNLPSGYHRDYQLTKEILFPAINDIKECIQIASAALPGIEINQNILDNNIYRYIGSVEAINSLVNNGMSFRDAYKTISLQIEKGEYNYSPTEASYTHTGSIGNPGNEMIVEYFKETKERYGLN